MKALLLQRTSLHGEIELTLESTKLKSESDYFRVALSFCVSQGGSLSHINLHFVVLTLWDYLTQEASHTIRFMLGIYCMTESRSWKRKRVLPNPRHKRLRHTNSLWKRRLDTIMLASLAIACVASVSSRVSRNNSIGNACYAGYPCKVLQSRYL